MIIRNLRVIDGKVEIAFKHYAGLSEEFFNFMGYIPISTKKVYLRALKREIEHKLKRFDNE